MKVQTANKKYDTNQVNTTKTKFDIDKNSAHILVSILRSKMYSDPIHVIPQEYISNALDANEEAGNSKSVEVYSPSRFEPVFRVRDYGPGILPDQIAEVFVKYGASTKRHSDDAIGGFGIGAKCAWSYTDSFQIKTFVDGYYWEYLAHLGEDEMGTLELLSEGLSEELNGTEITIVCKSADIWAFHKMIARVVLYSHSDIVFANDNQYQENKPEFYKITDSFWVQEDRLQVLNDEDSYILVKGIPYILESSHFEEYENFNVLNNLMVKGKTRFFLCGPESVEVSASREALMYTSHTIKGLQSVFDKGVEELNAHITALKAGNSLSEQIKAVQPLMKVFKELKIDAYTLSYKDHITASYFEHFIMVERGVDYNGTITSSSTRYCQPGKCVIRDDPEETNYGVSRRTRTVIEEYSDPCTFFTPIDYETERKEWVVRNNKSDLKLIEKYIEEINKNIEEQKQGLVKLREDLNAQDLSTFERAKNKVSSGYQDEKNTLTYKSVQGYRRDKLYFLEEHFGNTIYYYFEKSTVTGLKTFHGHQLSDIGRYIKQNRPDISTRTIVIAPSNVYKIRKRENFIPITHELLKSFLPSDFRVFASRITITSDLENICKFMAPALDLINDPIFYIWGKTSKRYSSNGYDRKDELIRQIANILQPFSELETQWIDNFEKLSERIFKNIKKKYPLLTHINTNRLWQLKSSKKDLIDYMNLKHKESQ